jgi:uncharacterized protein YegL
MNDNLTEIVFILDRSGSMAALEKDTIGGFNSFIENQKKEPGEAVLTTVLFDSLYEVLHDHVNLKKVKPLTNKDYFARGTTALMDAVGLTINSVGARLNSTPESERPGKVIFVITTDGLENSSHEYSPGMIKNMITHQTEVYKWTFLFLGANIDAVKTAESYGIPAVASANYDATSRGTQSMYSSVSHATKRIRDGGSLTEDWKPEQE